MIDMVLIVLEHKDLQNFILLDLVPKLNVKVFFARLLDRHQLKPDSS
jgi:hypothetical protein